MALTPKRPGLLKEWWSHKASLIISSVITVVALGIYAATFMGERPMPVFYFITRLELNSLDLRFQLRGRTQPDPRIIIVDIDQHSQEVLGQWPFGRIYFAHLLDALREDGARVAAFDITFSQAEDKELLPLKELGASLDEQQKKGQAVSPALRLEIEREEKKYNYDQQFADAIQRFGNVVLGNYFLYTKADLQGVSNEALDRYANLMAFFPFPQVRPEPSAGGEAGRLRLIQQYEDLYLVPRGVEGNTELLTGAVASEKGGSGFFNVAVDADTVVRRMPLAIPYGRDADRANWDMYASIDVQTLRLYLGLTNEQTVLNYGGAGVTSIEFGPKLTVHPDDLSRMMVNYNGPVRTYPYISFADAAQKKFAAGTFKDKIVLVGASATGIGDLRATPFGAIDFPGVEIHANLIDNILNQKFLMHGGPQVLTDLAFIFLFGIPLGMWLALVQPRWMAFTLLLLVPFAGVVYWAFLHGWWLNFIVPSLFTLVPNVGLVALYRVLIEEQEKRKVRGAFQQYVSPEVIRRVLSDPELVQPRKSEITVLFSDVRGFTTISEALDAQDLARLLNGYLTEMTRIIFRHQGTLDKYIGDAVMAIWGAPFTEPKHGERCCQAALSMLSRLVDLQEKWRADGFPAMEIGIGINTGIASVGNMGSSLRYGYTAMGDTVNLASRLEGLNKEYGTSILISESTRADVTNERIMIREIDFIRVKGKNQPVTIFEILSEQAAANDGKELIELFGRGREAYKARDWSAAKAAFEEVLNKWPKDGPSRVFIGRCDEYLAAGPGADWDGVYVMMHK
ncbi:MAG TPA: adenylate/guanylate cyclase domain-containing protein [Candidatus Acidoferrales bacterium]|nr:adenylate/guanylate cyclase domain-containing protein [Candidatus Acidoferrales bacterium]